MTAEQKMKRSGPKIGWSGAQRGAVVAEDNGAGADCEVTEREWAELAAHNPLQPNIPLTPSKLHGSAELVKVIRKKYRNWHFWECCHGETP